MESYNMRNTIELLKSSNNSELQETLVKLKNDISKTQGGIKLFREAKGLQALMPLLYRPNDTVLDLTLSILGNCCLEEKSLLLAGELNYFSAFGEILSVSKKDSILGRTCRVIGNMCQNFTNAENLHKHGVVSPLVRVIETKSDSTSRTTLAMAVRAIRNLWKVTKRREEMLQQNAVKILAELFVAECQAAKIFTFASSEKIEMKTDSRELLNTIVKCLSHISVHITPSFFEQISPYPEFFTGIVVLMKVFKKFASRVVMNICYLSSGRIELGKANIVEYLVLLFGNESVSDWPEGLDRCLSQLSGESVNRSRLLHSGGLSLIVDAAKESPYAMHALLQYVFDDYAFNALLNYGLVSILIQQLQRHLTIMKCEHECKDIKESEPLPHCSKNLASGSNAETFKRKQNFSSDEDNSKVIIQRDNMLVSFLDRFQSSSDSDYSERRAMISKVRRKGKNRRSAKKYEDPEDSTSTSNNWPSSIFWEPVASQNNSNSGQMSPSSDQSGMSPEYRCRNKRTRHDWSPESGFDGDNSVPWYYQESPPLSLSPPGSPQEIHYHSSESDNPGRYSPVFSETSDKTNELAAALVLDELDDLVLSADSDEDEVPEGASCSEGASKHVNSCRAQDLAAALVTDHLDDLIVNDESDDDETIIYGRTNKSMPQFQVSCVLVLFYRVAHGVCTKKFGSTRHSPLETLTSEDSLNALLDYIELCKRPYGRGSKILSYIFNNPLCVTNILKNNVVQRIYNMAESPKHALRRCQQCKQITRLSWKFIDQITKLVECSYGIGQISYHFKMHSDHVKFAMATSLPYVLKTSSCMKKYFSDCNGLASLIEIIKESKICMNKGFIALQKIAECIQIKNPKLLEKRFKTFKYITYNPMLDNDITDNCVTFEFDDGSTIQANKTILCDNSDVFSAMLLGNFKESKDNIVRLENVPKDAFEYILTLIFYGLNRSSEVDEFPMPKKVRTNLEALILADRYLLENIKVLMYSAIIQFIIKPGNVLKIYKWSLLEGMGYLCVESVAFILTGKMTEPDRSALLEEIWDMEQKDQCMKDIQTLLMRQLTEERE